MTLPPEPAHIPDEAEAASAALHWQMASARAAVAKHHARLVDQLDADAPDSAETGPPFR
jgi:hypothetical protein